MELVESLDNIPIIDYKTVKYLNEYERKLSKFFKCANYGQKCLYTSNNYTKFRAHLRTHSKMYCFYCYQEKRGSGGMYYCSELDSMLNHVLSVHGLNCFQCNLCAYRAYTTIHVRFHQLLSHRKYVVANSQTDVTLIDESNLYVKSTICKIIKCKNILYGPPAHYSLYFDLLSEKLNPKKYTIGYYCLFCGFRGNVPIAVYIHFVKQHCDREISVWHNLNKNSIFELDYTGTRHTSKLFDDVEAEYAGNDETVDIKSEKTSIPGLESNFKLPNNFNPKRSALHAKRYYEQNNAKRNVSFDPTIRRATNSAKRKANSDKNDGVLESNPIDDRPPPPHIVLNAKEFSDLNREHVPNPPTARKTTTFTKVIANKNENAKNSPNKSVKINKFQKLDPKKAKKVIRGALERQKLLQKIAKQEEEENLQKELEKIPKRGVKARFENRSFFEPTAITKLGAVSVKERNVFRCLICKMDDLRENKIAQHLQVKHNTRSSFRCGHCKDYVNEKVEIREHIKLRHPNSEENIEKFIVPSGQQNAIALTPSTAINRPVTEPSATFVRPAFRSSSATARKKPTKGSLMQQIKESTFLGPLKNDVTQRKNLENDANSDNIDDTPVPIPEKPKRKIKLKPSQVAKKSTAKRPRNPSGGQITSNNQNEASSSNAKMETNKNDYALKTEPNSYAKNQTDVKPGDLKPVRDIKNVLKVEKDVKVKLETNDEFSNIVVKTEPVSQYFCIFCTDIELKVLNNKKEAIEHYKAHLNLGYYCGLCDALVTTYDDMVAHYALKHPTVSDISQREHMPESIRNWILQFLDNQMTDSQLVHNRKKSLNSINIDCPVCEKAAVLNNAQAKYFKSLWEVRAHLIKHFAWNSMQCSFCAEDFPSDGYILMHHLANDHRESNEIFYYSFRGHKPFYDLNPQQIATIEDYFSKTNVESSEILDALFRQLISKLTVKYENDMKWRHRLRRDVTICLKRMPDIKAEPIDIAYDAYEQNVENMAHISINEKNTDDNDDDIIVLDSDSDGEQFIYSKLMGDQYARLSPENSTKVKTEPQECLTLSSDDES